MRRQGGVVAEAGAGLFLAPTQPVQAGVGHQTTGAPHLIAEAAEPLIGRAIDAHFFAQELGIEAPAFAEGRDRGAAAVIGLVGGFLLQGYLQVVARNGLVHREGGQFIQGPLVQLAGVDDVAAGHARRHRAGVVAAGGVGLLHLDRHRTHAIGQARQGGEQGRQAVVRALGDLGRLLQQFFARLGVELRVGAQEGQEAGEVAGPAGGAHLRLHAGADAGDFFNADLMHLIGRQVGGRVAADEEGVQVAAAGAVDQTRLLRGLGRVFVA
ncbi:hypothetical protein D3C73_1015630 [compost metagenome]